MTNYNKKLLLTPKFKGMNFEFSSEQTAIKTGHSKTAEMVASNLNTSVKTFDYGCGTGRNINYIGETTGIYIDGCDILEQLERSKFDHDLLRCKGSRIEVSSKFEPNTYDLILNSHVLNVVESDEVKQFILQDIYNLLKVGGTAFIEVRTKQDVEGAKTKVPFGQGWKIKKGSSYTYQESITKDKMLSLVKYTGFKVEEHICNSSRHLIIVSK